MLLKSDKRREATVSLAVEVKFDAIMSAPTAMSCCCSNLDEKNNPNMNSNREISSVCRREQDALVLKLTVLAGF
jgi:hypothetical protein